ncbi:MAG: hypothetical protein CXZ00_03175 [Acidobacteria bacterium]|nr:MAG: hypothetical protein CXZ00_03175 [Acidobacteriota bacterium]
MKSSEMKMRHAKEMQVEIVQAISDGREMFGEDSIALTNFLLSKVLVGVVEAGHSITEELCELREAVDRLTEARNKQ